MTNKVVEVRNGLKFTFSVPSDTDEYVKAANRGVNVVLEDALDTNIYRTGLPDAWYMLAVALATEFSEFARKDKAGNVIKVKDQVVPDKLQKPHPTAEKAAKGELVDKETDPQFVDRVLASKVEDKTYASDVAALEAVQTIIGTFESIPLDLTERKGAGGGALVGKADMEMASQFIASGPEKCGKALATIAETLGTTAYVLVGDAVVDQKQVALQIKAYRTELAKRQLQALTA